MSCSTTTSLPSFGDSFTTKKQSKAQLKNGIFSSLRVKKRTGRPSVGELFESRWSLNSLNSLSTDDYNWSLQPNYLKMMNDTNLIDNCAAVKEEIESVPQVTAGQWQFLETNKSKTHQMTVDPGQLLQWIVYMEKYLEAFSPTWKQVNEMDEHQRSVSFNEQCDLRQYIASHNKIFNQMIKDQDSERTRNVQGKYHMLLLNAIEKQCLLEGYPKVQGDKRLSTYDCPDVKLDVYKLCSIDIEPQSNPDHLDYTLIRPSESLSSNSDAETITTSDDDGIHLPTHPTTSKSSMFSEDQCSPFSSNLDFQHKDHQSWECILKELDSIVGIDNKIESSNGLPKNRKASNSSMSKSTLKLIENVDSVLPTAGTLLFEEHLDTNSKVDDWLIQHPDRPSESKIGRVTDIEMQISHKICSSSSGSDLGSTMSIQWDNFQDVYRLTAPIHEECNKDFLFFGDDYDDVLKCSRGSLSSISNTHKSSTSTPTTPSKSEKSMDKFQENRDETIAPNQTKMVCRKKKRLSRKLNNKNETVAQQSIENDSSKMAKDILLIVENLRSNYMNLKPRDFDGILTICKENLGCLIVVLDKEQRSHYESHESIKSVGDDRIYIQENCQCGLIGQFVARIVRFLYDCGRSVRKSPIYRFLFRILKHFYAMVKFVSRKVRFYKCLYGN